MTELETTIRGALTTRDRFLGYPSAAATNAVVTRMLKVVEHAVAEGQLPLLDELTALNTAVVDRDTLIGILEARVEQFLGDVVLRDEQMRSDKAKLGELRARVEKQRARSSELLAENLSYPRRRVAEKQGGQMAPPNAPVPPVSRVLPEPPPRAQANDSRCCQEPTPVKPSDGSGATEATEPTPAPARGDVKRSRATTPRASGGAGAVRKPRSRKGEDL